MKVIIAGSRHINDIEFILNAIDESGWEITEVVCGMASGVDRIGKAWAEEMNIPVKPFPADWNRYGKSAGPIRNGEMADYADAAIVIWDGKSRGSKNMIEQMGRRGKPVKFWRYKK